MVPQPQVEIENVMDSFKIHEVFNILRRKQRPLDIPAEPRKGQGLIPAELPGKLRGKNKVW